MPTLQQKLKEIRDYKKEHPAATYDEMRSRFECSYSTVSMALREKIYDGDTADTWLDKIAKQPTSPVVQFASSCPKTWEYIASQLAWAKRNKKKYLAHFLAECMKEMMAVV